MTALTADDYVTRVRAILATLSGIGTDVTAGADLAITPGYEVFVKGGEHTPGASRRRTVARVVSVRIYHTLVDADLTKEAPIRSARAAAQAALETFVDTLFAHINLSLNDGGLAVTGAASDSLGLMPYNGHVYYGFDIDLTISYYRG